MKTIFIDSMFMHLIVTMIFISFSVNTGDFFYYALALFYVCLTIRHAINIADFEMSGLGKVVKIHESAEYRRTDVYFTK